MACLLTALQNCGVEAVSLVKIPLEGPVGIIPGAEVVQLAPDLLGPPTRCVRKEREAGVGFRGFL